MGFPNWRSFHSSADYTCWPHVCYFLSTNLCFCATRCISHSLHQDDSLCVFLALLLTWTFSIRSRARTQESSFWNLPIIVICHLCHLAPFVVWQCKYILCFRVRFGDLSSCTTSSLIRSFFRSDQIHSAATRLLTVASTPMTDTGSFYYFVLFLVGLFND